MESSEEYEYTPDQQRVSDYLQELTKGQAGSGADPVGFLIASHRALSQRPGQCPDWDFLDGGPHTPDKVRALAQRIFQVGRQQGDWRDMLTNLSFIAGVAAGYLIKYAELLEVTLERES